MQICAKWSTFASAMSLISLSSSWKPIKAYEHFDSCHLCISWFGLNRALDLPLCKKKSTLWFFSRAFPNFSPHLKVEKSTGCNLIRFRNVIIAPIDTILDHFRRIQHIPYLLKKTCYSVITLINVEKHLQFSPRIQSICGWESARRWHDRDDKLVWHHWEASKLSKLSTCAACFRSISCQSNETHVVRNPYWLAVAACPRIKAHSAAETRHFLLAFSTKQYDEKCSFLTDNWCSTSNSMSFRVVLSVKGHLLFRQSSQ